MYNEMLRWQRACTCTPLVYLFTLLSQDQTINANYY